MFRTKPIQQGRISQPASTWGTPPVEYLRTFQASPQPFTGDDHTVNDQFTQNVRDIIVIYDPTFDIKFEDKLYYNGIIHTVVYVLKCDNGVIDHLEVFVADSQEEIPTWVV